MFIKKPIMKKIFLFICFSFAVAFQSCFNSVKKINLIASNEMEIDSSGGSCPFLTEDNDGNTVLSWIKSIDSSTNVFSYAVSKDGGHTFGKTIEIPGSNNILPHGENVPKIIFKPSGEIIAVWGASNPNPKNAYAGNIFYAQSFDNGTTWTKATNLVKDTAGFDQRYFDVAILPDGEAGIIWLDNRKKSMEDGSSLFFAETKNKSGFQNERWITGPCCPCCRTDLFVDSKKNIHILYRAISKESIRDMVHTVSTDDGKTLSTPKRISDDNWVINGCPHTGPAMTENKNGIQFTWFTGGKNAGVYYCNSTDNGKTFSPRTMVSGLTSRHCQITNISNDDIAIVWNENFSEGNISSSRIGIETRSANGNDPEKQFITSETGDASFPVIKSMSKESLLVAYTKNVKDRNYVKYSIVKF